MLVPCWQLYLVPWDTLFQDKKTNCDRLSLRFESCKRILYFKPFALPATIATMATDRLTLMQYMFVKPRNETRTKVCLVFHFESVSTDVTQGKFKFTAKNLYRRDSVSLASLHATVANMDFSISSKKTTAIIGFFRRKKNSRKCGGKSGVVLQYIMYAKLC